MNFITRATKVKCIVASVITALALITLIMLSTLLNLTPSNKVILCLIFSISLMLILLIWQGIVEIKVFNDYKSQNKHLCADGIINLCMGALIAICASLFGILQASKVIKGISYTTIDIRIFLVMFITILIVWKGSLLVLSIKQKRFNAWCDLLSIILWLSLDVLVQVSLFVNTQALTSMAWAIIINSWLIIAENIFYILFSYVIKTPTYLETPINVSMLQEDEIEIKCAKINKPTENTRIYEKLKKLKDLKDNGLITSEDYENKKKQILENL